MEVSGMAAAASQQSQEKVQEQVQVSLMRQEMDMQEANAAQLLEALPDAPSGDPSAGAANPAEAVGSLINVSA